MEKIVVLCKAHTGYRRAGVQFTKGENEISLDHISPTQLAQIQADPRLVVKSGEGQGDGEANQGSGSEKLLEPDGMANGVSFADAVAKLDASNAEHFTGSGKPQVAALSELMGQTLSAKDRDEAWEALQQERGDA